MAAVHHLGFVIRRRATTNDGYLIVFSNLQNLVGIGCVALKRASFNVMRVMAVWLENHFQGRNHG